MELQPKAIPVLLLECPTSICVSKFWGVYCRLMSICILHPTLPPLPSPSLPQGLRAPARHLLGAPTRQFVCNAPQLLRASPAKAPALVLATPPREISTLHFIRGPLMRPLMSMLSGHT